jgi:hypothetical protein
LVKENNMTKIYPKFDKKIADSLSAARIQQTKTRPGVVMSFDRKKNTAIIVLEDKMSGSIGEIIKDVPCPDIQGVQTVAPTAGSRCIVSFRDDNERYPHIVSFINDINFQSKYRVNYGVDTGVPNFLI